MYVFTLKLTGKMDILHSEIQLFSTHHRVILKNSELVETLDII